MTLLKNLFIAFVMVVIATSHQLDSMDWQSFCTPVHVSPSQPVIAASDFQIYQLLSAATKDNPELYLPDEVTCVIAINACDVTKKLRAECYQKYGKYLCSADSTFDLINNSLKIMPHMTIVAILKTCLSYSSKSLNEIKNSNCETVLHCGNLLKIGDEFIPDYVKIVLLVAGDKSWNLITERDDFGHTALHYFSFFWKEGSIQKSSINELLSTAPSSEEIWSLINARDSDGQTPLGLATQYGKKEFIKLFESYRPK